MNLYRTLLIAVLNIGLLGNAVADINDGLIAYYPFNGNANDESGNGNHGEVNGNTSFISGINSTGIKLNGEYSDNIEIPYNLNSNLNTISNALTISYWINKKSGASGGTGPNRWHYTQKAWHTGVSLDNKISFAIADKDFAPNGVSGHEVSASQKFEIPNETWAHILLIFEEGRYSGFLNGVKQVEEMLSIILINEQATLPILIGKQGDTCCNDHLDASIDELRIYNRALSDDEIEELYNEGSAPNEEEPETPVAILSENLDIHIPVLHYQVNESATANLDVYLSLVPNEEASLTWKLKSYDNIICSRDKNSCSNTPTASTSSSNEANSRTPFDVHIPTILYNSKTYWAHLEYTGNQDKNFIWQLKNYGDFDDNVPPKLSAQPVSSSEALWSQLVLKARVGDILIFGNDRRCSKGDGCYDSSSTDDSWYGFSYGYYSHAAIITAVNQELNELEIFHAKGPYGPNEGQVSKDIINNEWLKAVYVNGMASLIRVKDVDDKTAINIANVAFILYDNYTYSDLSHSSNETYCSKLILDAYQNFGFDVGDQDTFDKGSVITKLLFTPDELSQSKNIKNISSWWYDGS